jgi:tetratricopeptide (TPR) repeat protein
VNRLRNVLRNNDARESDFDRLRTAALDARNAGESARSETIAQQIVRRYPRDPRAYSVLSGILSGIGKLAAAEQIWQRGLALDSLSMQAGAGPCTACGGYGELARLQMAQGKWAEAEHSMRRWLALQPNAPVAWRLLSTLLSYTQRYDEAFEALRRAMSLGNFDQSQEQYGRLLIMARRFDSADSLIAAWSAGPSAGLRVLALDLRLTLARERGQFRASNAAIEQMVAAAGVSGVTELVRGNNLGRLGDYAGAIATYERAGHPPGSTVVFPMPGSRARGFCWHHALLADAIAPSGDTTRLRAIADTLERACTRSLYGRDTVLYHHVRGLVAMQQGRWTQAEEEFRHARLQVAEWWTRTNAALAEVQLHLGRPRDALATLRDAYATPLDAMGRYEPRSEVDYLMSVAFRAAKEPDSAAVYEGYARRAWRNADPEVRRRLGNPPAP